MLHAGNVPLAGKLWLPVLVLLDGLEYDKGMGNPLRGRDLFQKICSLPDEKVAEVESFVDFLSRREDDRSLVHAASRLSSESLRKVWDNPDDAGYDLL